MNELFNGLDYVRTYIDDLLIICNKYLEGHIEKQDKVLNKLKTVGFKVNAYKSFFVWSELEYLYFKITKQGIIPLPDTVKAIKSIALFWAKKKLHRLN